MTAELMAACPCDQGCPSCIHSPKCGSGNKPLDKAAALFLVKGLLGEFALEVEPTDHGTDLPITQTEELVQQTRGEPAVLISKLSDWRRRWVVGETST